MKRASRRRVHVPNVVLAQVFAFIQLEEHLGQCRLVSVQWNRVLPLRTQLYIFRPEHLQSCDPTAVRDLLVDHLGVPQDLSPFPFLNLERLTMMMTVGSRDVTFLQLLPHLRRLTLTANELVAFPPMPGLVQLELNVTKWNAQLDCSVWNLTGLKTLSLWTAGAFPVLSEWNSSCNMNLEVLHVRNDRMSSCDLLSSSAWGQAWRQLKSLSLMIYCINVNFLQAVFTNLDMLQHLTLNAKFMEIDAKLCELIASATFVGRLESLSLQDRVDMVCWPSVYALVPQLSNLTALKLPGMDTHLTSAKAIADWMARSEYLNINFA